MKQPTKDILREQLVLAAEKMIRQQEEIDRMWEANCFLNSCLNAPVARRWWHRLMWWR